MNALSDHTKNSYRRHEKHEIIELTKISMESLVPLYGAAYGVSRICLFFGLGTSFNK